MNNPDTGAPTTSQIEMARRVVVKHLDASGGFDNTGQQAVLAGQYDHWSEIQCALAAIIETQEADAKLADSIKSDGLGTSQSWAGWRNAKLEIATAIRSGNHYGKGVDRG